MRTEWIAPLDPLLKSQYTPILKKCFKILMRRLQRIDTVPNRFASLISTILLSDEAMSMSKSQVMPEKCLATNSLLASPNLWAWVMPLLTSVI